MPSAAAELCFLSATELVGRIKAGAVSAVEVMQAHLAQIDRLNPRLNAIVTLLPERAMDGARTADAARARGAALGPLHGLPIAHKDLALTRGIRTTFGSPIYADNVPDTNALIVDRLQAAGAITIGKTNTPEFGAGSQTFNPVFGATRNPYDLTKTCGGSSGGAAVALACGFVPIADGSDLGGSLRNPASFCNVVGLRPSPGRVPNYPDLTPWSPFSVVGPMARTVEDIALQLTATAGPDPRAPISIAEPGRRFAAPLPRDFRGVRIAWSRDLGGLPIDPRVLAALEPSRAVLADLGAAVVDAQPDFAGADESFRAWRAWRFELAYGHLLDTHRSQLKDTVIWNIEEGRRLTGSDLARAERRRGELYQRVHDFMVQHEYLVCPVVQVPPFSVDTPYPTSIAGRQMETYLDWMRSCYYITVTGLPAISVPAGFTPEGLPVGLQIVGRHQADFSVLQLAHAFQAATGTGRRRPPICG